ncbi:MAG: SDR family oxidoreductase [Acidiferrobacterales bacterium]
MTTERSTTLITGANRGIGLELVRQYAEAGWRVFACCRRPSEADVLNELTTGGLVSVHQLDVTDARERETMKATVGSTPIDVLINNAGIYGQRDADFGNSDEDRWLETLRVNVIAPLKVMETLADAVAASKRKLIANLSSRMGSIGDNDSGGSYVYRSSKAALNQIVKSAANDLHERGITVVALHPGWVRTDMGGGQALIDVNESVTGLRKVLDRATLKDSGKFFNYDGAIVSW